MDKEARRNYSAEFKKEAVALASRSGQTITGVAQDLGIGPGLIQRWKRELTQHGRQAFVGQGGFPRRGAHSAAPRAVAGEE